MLGKNTLVDYQVLKSNTVDRNFEIFKEKYRELSSINASNPDELPHIESLILEICKNIQAYRIEISDDFVHQSRIVSFIQNLLNFFSENASMFEKCSVFLFYIMVSSRAALADFLELGEFSQNYIQRLFNSSNLKERQICYEILIRMNDSQNRGISCQAFCESINIYNQVIQRMEEILSQNDFKSIQSSEVTPYLNNVSTLLRVILKFTNFLSSESLNPFLARLLNIFGQILSIKNPNLFNLLTRYAIYSLLFLTREEFYQSIIEKGLFIASMEYAEFPETASFVALFASQMLQVCDGKQSEEFVKTSLPLSSLHKHFLVSKDDQLIHCILTLFINSINFSPALIEALTSESGLKRLFELIQSDNTNVQNRTVWCIWCILRYGSLDYLTNILRDDDLCEILVEISFNMDDFNFIKSVLVPGILSLDKNIKNAAVGDQDPYEKFMNSLSEPLKDLSYKEDSPITQCIAASCLKIVFPEIYSQQPFN